MILRLRLKVRLFLIVISLLALYTGLTIGWKAHGNGLYFLLFIFPWMCILVWSVIGGPLRIK